MGKRVLVQPGPITAEALTPLLSARSRFPVMGEDLPFEEAAGHARGQICPEEEFVVLDWHIKEIRHLNVRKQAALRWPVIGPLIRDQHEINRLILIALEMSYALSIRVEGEIGRVFGNFRQADRSYWVKQFRYLGSRWAVGKRAVQRFREGWELGRSTRHRLRPRAGQAGLNPLIEEALIALSEAVSVLSGIFSSKALGNCLHAHGCSGFEHIRVEASENRLESCLWHAREGHAIRRRNQGRPAWLFDYQCPLNRAYRICLEEHSALLKELVHKTSYLAVLVETAAHAE